ncbi:MAG: Hpt domain-containing protein [Phycisphaerae bacterium]|nr:Hpt domain-containing protein [Phycisphaerae bacterium]
MAENQSINALLETLCVQVGKVDPADKKSVVRAGETMEKAYRLLEAYSRPAMEMLKLELEILKGIFQEQISAGETVEILARSLEASGEVLSGQSPGVKRIREANKSLCNILESAGLSVPARKTDSPADSKSSPSPARSLDKSLLINLSAQLLIIGPDDKQELDDAWKKLCEFWVDESLSMEMRERIGAAADLVGRVSSGRSSDPTAALTTAAGHLSLVANVLEETAEAGDVDQTHVPAGMDKKVLEEFVVTTLDIVGKAEFALMSLEIEPADQAHADQTQQAFEKIRQSAEAVGLEQIRQVAGMAEEVVIRGQKGEIRIVGGYADLALRSCDTIRYIAEHLKQCAPGDPLPLPDYYVEHVVQLSCPEGVGINEQCATESVRLGDILIGRGWASRADIEKVIRQRGDEPLGEALVHAGVVTASRIAKALRAQQKLQRRIESAAAHIAALPLDTPDATDAQGDSGDSVATGEHAVVAETVEPTTLPADSDGDLLKEYIVECLDHIAAAESSLLELESSPGDTEPINTIFRAFHTIKGTSGFLGLTNIQKLAHLAENQLDRAREGEIQIVGGYADLALQSCDLLRSMIEALDGKAGGDVLPVPDTLGRLLGVLKDPDAAGVGSQAGASAIASPAPTEEAQDSPVDVAEQQDSIAEEKGAPAEQKDAPQKVAEGKKSEASVRVTTTRLDSLINMVGELVIASEMVAKSTDAIAGASHRRAKKKKRRKATRQQVEAEAEAVETKRTSGRKDKNAPDQLLLRSVQHSGKIVRELQDVTMALRMVPLKATFQKMARLVRDLGRKSGKAVRFVTEGEDTEIDRNMVELLGDPLVHMMRNAVDHGVESAEDRKAAGKSETGTVTLRAYHRAGKVILELQDDGKGLAREKILAKATERGLVPPGRELSDSEVFMLIFQAGFSTAEKVTDVSGRGVGMDVVKRGIESLHGRVEVHSQVGEGTTFTIHLPLTMAITDAMILSVGQEKYLLSTVAIQHSFNAPEGSISTITGEGEMVRFHGQLFPIYRLSSLFHIPDAVDDPYDAVLVLVESNGRKSAIMVDKILGQQQVVVKNLGETFRGIPGVTGGAILGDGRIGLVLDVNSLVQFAQDGNSMAGSLALSA